MINITKHAYERYSRRIKEVSKEEVQSDIIVNKNLYHTELDKMFENSRLIYTGKFNDKHNETNFRIVDNIVLITDKMDTKIITLYRVEFGFNRNLDITILKELIGELDIAEQEYLEVCNEVNLEKDRLVTSRNILLTEIEEMKQSLKVMEESLVSLNDYIGKFDYKEKICKSNMETVAKKIVYSNIYRKEMESCM